MGSMGGNKKKQRGVKMCSVLNEILLKIVIEWKPKHDMDRIGGAEIDQRLRRTGY
jgi:hypothetical protein